MNPAARFYLNGRGITDDAIARYGIGGDGGKIIIPIRGFNKYRTYPEKHYFYDKGFKAALFGVAQLESSWCVLTEGEMDTLRLASEGIPAVSGTGGAGTFKDEWVQELPVLTFICYDTDQAGRDNALKVHWRVPGSRIVDLPEGKDVTEYFKSHTKDHFLSLLKAARCEPKPEVMLTMRSVKKSSGTDIERAKQFPIENLIKFNNKKAKCIWHNEKSPSMHLFPENRVHCFGCSKSGDAIDVYMALENCSLKEAIEKLA